MARRLFLRGILEPVGPGCIESLARLCGDLDKVSAVVVQHRGGRRPHLGRFLGEAHPDRAQALVFGLDILDGELSERDPVGDWVFGAFRAGGNRQREPALLPKKATRRSGGSHRHCRRHLYPFAALMAATC